MAILFDAEVTGADQIDFGGDVNLDRVTVTIVTRPAYVRELEVEAPDHIIRAGWMALGYFFSEGDQPPAIFWTIPRYVDFDTFLWANFTDSNGPVHYFRYFFTQGVTAHLLIGA